eukprot:TRINITY_DN6848_c0_g1_i1.p1 TRINITY_DN6848_c0_g1~~TRINITY_DN6848_c0_g1_i1.p1  ORF type:complete len:329 (+),score=84.92 TRINITY_DN6848_c0_g1_i1:59-1045(+)
MFFDSWGYDDGRPSYRGFADKSNAALRREQAAIEKFNALIKQQEGQLGDLTGPKSFPLLDPAEHLTGPCYTAFRKHVLKHEGWNCKRTVATPAEKKAHKIKRQGKCYFIEAVYRPSKEAVREAKRKSAVAQARAEVEAEDRTAKTAKGNLCATTSTTASSTAPAAGQAIASVAQPSSLPQTSSIRHNSTSVASTPAVNSRVVLATPQTQQAPPSATSSQAHPAAKRAYYQAQAQHTPYHLPPKRMPTTTAYRAPSFATAQATSQAAMHKAQTTRHQPLTTVNQTLQVPDAIVKNPQQLQAVLQQYPMHTLMQGQDATGKTTYVLVARK